MTALARAVGARALALGAVWWAVTEGAAPLWLGAVSVAAAVGVSLALAPPGRTRIRARALPGFLAHFAAQSLAGGADVAARAFRPGPPLAPGFVRYSLRVPDGPARYVFAATVSLLPGTLSARLADEVLTVHVLDVDDVSDDQLSRLEDRVGALFGVGR